MSYLAARAGVDFTRPVFQRETVFRPVEGHAATAWTEEYLQFRLSYSPLAYGSESARHARHYLVDESPAQPEGFAGSEIVRFSRTFAQIPASYTEPRLVAYTFPGISGRTTRPGIGFYWDKYLFSPPITLTRSAVVTFSYSMGVPSLSAPFQSFFNGVAVDFCGDVWAQPADDHAWTVAVGVTTPSNRPSSYLVSQSAERWYGPIYRKESVVVTL